MKTNKKGFTIIEVVLVLAIAGLIFLMVFIALPALQRSQRNTQREDDIARFLTAVNDYQTNNSGKTPFGTAYDKTKIGQFVNRYIDESIDKTGVNAGSSMACASGKDCAQFRDPDGTIYGWTVDVAAANKTDEPIKSDYGKDNKVDHMVHVYVNAGCGSTEGTYTTGTGDRQIAMYYVEEGGAIICNDNH